MPAPFYNAIKGTTSGTPGTGAFTPSAAATGFRAWSNVPSGWIGLVRFDDGANWELCYSYWNGTALSRASTQLSFDNPGGTSLLSLTSAATAMMVEDASRVQSHLGSGPTMRAWTGNPAGTTPASEGHSVPTTTGTGNVGTIATTNLATTKPRNQSTSATTANAQCGWSTGSQNFVINTTAGWGGGEINARFGATGLPTGPRLMCGMLGVTYVGSTAEPSALVGRTIALGLDSTDTNFQLLTNDGTGGGTKIDTGIPFVVGAWYEVSLWVEPGTTKVYCRLFRFDTGDIWLGSTTTDVPTNGALFPQLIGGLNGTNTGTAMVLAMEQIAWRTGA